MKNKVNIKGAEYSIIKIDEYLILNEELCEAVTNFDKKTITLSNLIPKDKFNKVFRHELVHAFFEESGLPYYSDDEKLVEWIARTIPEIEKIISEVKDVK